MKKLIRVRWLVGAMVLAEQACKLMGSLLQLRVRFETRWSHKVCDVDSGVCLKATEHVMWLAHADKTVLANTSSELASTIGHCGERWYRIVQLRVVLALTESKHWVALVGYGGHDAFKVWRATELVV